MSTPTASHESTFNQTQWEAIQAAIDAKLPNFQTAFSTLKSQKPETYTLGLCSDLNLWLFGVKQYLKFQRNSRHTPCKLFCHTSLWHNNVPLALHVQGSQPMGVQALPATWPRF